MTERDGTRGTPGPRSRLLLHPLHGRVGLRVEGEIDILTRPAWRTALDSLVDHGSDVDLELSRLAFVDAGGVAALVAVSERLAQDRLVTLYDAPRGMLRTLDVMFPSTPRIKVGLR